jgi:photosystem II stability/assembly factor-like uncharacterized protein
MYFSFSKRWQTLILPELQPDQINAVLNNFVLSNLHWCKPITMIFLRTMCTVALALLPALTSAQLFTWQITDSKTNASFRALSVVDDSVAWVAGTGGWIGRTIDGGNNWKFDQVPGFEQTDFRTLYAHDKNNAVIANAGSPANVLITEDGGLHWKIVYHLPDTAAFIDGTDFWNRNEGIIYGDPLGGRMLLLRTTDGGLTWSRIDMNRAPKLNDGEASFAASGTTIRCTGKEAVAIATGGKTSRLWLSENKGDNWTSFAVPILQGESSRGIFSIALGKMEKIIVVGGNYLQDTLRLNHVFYSRDGGKSWRKPTVETRGYRECVEYIEPDLLVATGPTGTDISIDGGISWRPESDEKFFHVVRKARKGTLVLIAGGKGKIGILKTRN